MNLTGLVESGAKDLGPRFNLIGVLPTVVLFLFIIALSWSGPPQNPPDVRAIAQQVEQVGGKEGIMLALGVLLFGLLMQPLQFSLMRVLEGYWNVPMLPWAGAWLSGPGIWWHGRRRKKLKEQTQQWKNPPDATPADSAGSDASNADKAEVQVSPAERARLASAKWRLSRAYPAPHRILPTALGNALRAAEDVPYKRYGLDAIVIWPRLYPLLPSNMTDILNDRRNQLDLAARFCAIFFLCAIISIFFLYKHGWWLLVPAVMVVLARLAYRGAVSAAIAYGESMQTAFDLYRFELYKALRIPMPANLGAEKKINQVLSDFLRQGLATKMEVLTYADFKS